MKPTVIAIVLSILLIGGALVVSRTQNKGAPTEEVAGANVSIEDGVQIIAIDAKGGYLPRKSVAQAGIPTVIRFNTAATFDCSASVRIPSLDISEMLPQTGSTDIPVGTPEVGPLQGTCGMGMYPFEVAFTE
jgi:plastocyanin domain-containing protein